MKPDAFDYFHVPVSDPDDKGIAALRVVYKACRAAVEVHARGGREHLIALEKLEESLMWSVKAITHRDRDERETTWVRRFD